MASQLLGIKTRFTNDLGSPLVGGQVYTYFAGTSTNQDSYSDADLTVPNTNPVILDDTGSADIFLNGAYRIRVFDKSGRFIEEQDNVTQAASQGDATELTNKVSAVESDLVTTNTELNKVKLDTGITATAKLSGVARTQAEKNSDTVSVKDFGAKGDGATDDTQALKNALLSGAKNIYVPEGVYCISDTLKVPKNVKLNGAGIGYFYDHPVTFLFMGAGSKDYIMEGVTDTVYQVANPSIGEAYLADSGTRGDVYKLNNYAENFSVCVEVLEASQLSNVFITVDNDGVAGYTNSSSNTLAKGWDVGLLCRNANSALISRVWAFGHFAKAGVLVTAHSFAGDTAIPSSELLRFSECGFSGQFGVSIRCQEVITTTANYGFGGTTFDKCYIRGIEQNAYLATSSNLTNYSDRPSGAIEISGKVVRGINFNACTLITRQDINIIAGKCSDINFVNCYEESKQIKVNTAWIETSTGSRLVTFADSNINFYANEKYGVDTSPNMARESAVSRYASADGVCATTSLVMDENYDDVRYASYTGRRLRRANDYYAIADYKNQVTYVFTNSGELVFFDPTKNPIISRRDSTGTTQRIFWVSATTGDIEHYGNLFPSTDLTMNLGYATKRYAAVHSRKISSYGINQNPTTNGELVLTTESNTSVSIRLQGTDGVVRKAILTLA